MKLIKNILGISLLSLLSLAVFSSWTYQDVDFGDVLKKADFYRGGQVEGVSWHLEVQNTEQGKLKNELTLFLEASTVDDRLFSLITWVTN